MGSVQNSVGIDSVTIKFGVKSVQSLVGIDSLLICPLIAVPVGLGDDPVTTSLAVAGLSIPITSCA